MKQSVFAAAILLAAASSFGGVTYDYRAETTGLQQHSVDGSVVSDGANMKMTVAHGDDMMFKSGAIALSRDGGRTIDVYDPASKTYYEISLDQISANIGGVLKSSGVNVSFVNPIVNVTDGGDGGAIEGFPTQKATLDASIDINIDAGGQSMTSKMSMHSESWTTDKLGANAMNLFQQRSMQTGVEALDKLIAAQATALKGRFPLKQVTTVRMNMGGGSDMATTTTASVSNVKQTAVDASTFVPPVGYTRVDNPLERMTKAR
jgi:hypothetical protein